MTKIKIHRPVVPESANRRPHAPITIEVFGKPQPAGSKRSLVPVDRHGEPYRKAGRIVVSTVDDNPRAKDWQRIVADAAARTCTGPPLTGPLSVSMTFFRTRPKSHYGSGRNSGVLKASAPAHPTNRPDLLKLARAVEDALTGIVWCDDAQVVIESLQKKWDEKPGVSIAVLPLS
ncbi:MAG: RusA family crossover junction endodeoxyribonuclease [Planctomycetaceae bacterium]